MSSNQLSYNLKCFFLSKVGQMMVNTLQSVCRMVLSV